VQQRSLRGGRIDPENTKAAIRIMEVNPSLATMSKADVDRIARVIVVRVGDIGQAVERRMPLCITNPESRHQDICNENVCRHDCEQ